MRPTYHNRFPRPGSIYMVCASVEDALRTLKADGRNPDLFTCSRTEGVGIVVRYWGTTHEQRTGA